MKFALTAAFAASCIVSGSTDRAATSTAAAEEPERVERLVAACGEPGALGGALEARAASEDESRAKTIDRRALKGFMLYLR